jgi:hypothetical protein
MHVKDRVYCRGGLHICAYTSVTRKKHILPSKTRSKISSAFRIRHRRRNIGVHKIRLVVGDSSCVLLPRTYRVTVLMTNTIAFWRSCKQRSCTSFFAERGSRTAAARCDLLLPSLKSEPHIRFGHRRISRACSVLFQFLPCRLSPDASPLSPMITCLALAQEWSR